MRRTAIAEWVLSLVMSPERASATAGDLAESAQSGLWMPVARIVFGTAFRQMKESPGKMAAAATASVLLPMALLPVVTQVVGSIVFALQSGISETESSDFLIKFDALSFPVVVAGAMLLVAPYLAGRILGRWLRGAELAAFVAILTLGFGLWTAVLVLRPAWMIALLVLVPSPLTLPPMLAGLLQERRKWLRAN